MSHDVMVMNSVYPWQGTSHAFPAPYSAVSHETSKKGDTATSWDEFNSRNCPEDDCTSRKLLLSFRRIPKARAACPFSFMLRSL